ncbi:hypothetical protein CW304_21910 [Bacillus sp. UFRGS-B20]|nr:hypothetical protein CW304_21910 [Bacillus sp. UFRGS-B20]
MLIKEISISYREYHLYLTHQHLLLKKLPIIFYKYDFPAVCSLELIHIPLFSFCVKIHLHWPL